MRGAHNAVHHRRERGAGAPVPAGRSPGTYRPARATAPPPANDPRPRRRRRERKRLHVPLLCGPFGLAIPALALPLIKDLLLIHLASQHAARTPVYVLQSTGGSVLGSYALYAFVRAGRRLLLWRRSSSRATASQAAGPVKANPGTAAALSPSGPRAGAGKVARGQRWLGGNDFAGLGVGSLPPPSRPI